MSVCAIIALLETHVARPRLFSWMAGSLCQRLLGLCAAVRAVVRAPDLPAVSWWWFRRLKACVVGMTSLCSGDEGLRCWVPPA